ncbi:MAG: hypothetical protein QMC04_00585, partial [Ilumatobacter sp.]
SEVETDEVFVIPFDAIFGHRRLLLFSRWFFGVQDITVEVWYTRLSPETNVTIPRQILAST